MLRLYLCGAIAGIFLLGSVLLKLLLWPLKVRTAARRWFKVTLLSYLLSLPLFLILTASDPPLLPDYKLLYATSGPVDQPQPD